MLGELTTFDMSCILDGLAYDVRGLDVYVEEEYVEVRGLDDVYVEVRGLEEVEE
jgi:hypothetical protein